LLESISALSSAEVKKGTSQSGNYQDTVSTSLDAEDDSDDATSHNDQDEQDIHSLHPINASNNIFMAVDKLHKIVHAVWSSPQCKQTWFHQVSDILDKKDPSNKQWALMLILDAKT
ncbi:hypothetical protein H0H87_008991, partial [Tephrocybe sp. NHM501043]